MTLDDAVTPAPSFVTFDPLTRRITISPAASDAGIYRLQVNYNYLFDSDPDNKPETHEHSVPLTVEVTKTTWDSTDVSKYHIPTNQTGVLAPGTNSSNSTNTTLPDD